MLHKLISHSPKQQGQGQDEHERAMWQHKHMVREDLQGHFYRKLNHIVMLQQSEQAYHQREILMISHRQHQHQSNKQLAVHPLTFLAKSMVKQNQKLRKELQIRKKEAQARIQLSKLQTNKKCLTAQIQMFIDKLKDIAQEYYNEQQVAKAEFNLIEHGKKYSLTTPILSFVSSIKDITTKNIIVECVKQSLKKNNLNQSKLLKLQDFSLSLGHSSNQKELLDHITLYLRQFKSTTVFKELSQLLNHFCQLYNNLNIHSHYLYGKLVEQIDNNLICLSRTNKQIQIISNQLKDYHIQIYMLTQQSKNTKQEIRELQERSSKCIAEEAAFLSKEYGEARSNLQQQNGDVDYNAYFHEQLKAKYQNFIRNQLQDAQHISILKQKIQDQTKYISQLLKEHHQEPSFSSQLLTHRTFQSSSYTSVLRQSKTNNTSKDWKSHTKDSPLKKHSFKQPSQQGKQKFIVTKQLKIRFNSNSSTPHHSKENGKIYEAKVTRKHLIFQEATPNCLRVDQKIDMRHISGYKLQGQNHVRFICGANSVKLYFLSKNMKGFINKFEEAFRYLKKGFVNY